MRSEFRMTHERRAKKKNMGKQLIHQELYSYLRQHLKDDELMKKLLLRNRMTPFFPDIRDDSRDFISNIIKKKRFQKHEEALAQFKRKLDEIHIPFVVLKGMALAVELYDDEPYQRSFGDIDILVLPSNLEQTLDILHSIGYEKSEDLPVESFLRDPNHEHHYPCLIRRGGQLDSITLEVHVDAVPRWIFQTMQPYTDKLLLHAHVNQYGMPVMDGCDTVIFLMLHLLKHYVFDMLMGTVSGKAEAEVDLRAIHEIALFIDKVKNPVLRDMLEIRASEYHVVSEIRFVCRIISDIYPSLADFLSVHPAVDDRACFSKRFSIEAMKIDTHMILFGDKFKFLCNIIGRLQKDAYRFACHATRGINGANPVQVATLSSRRFLNDNRFGTYLDVLNDAAKPECVVTFYLGYDKDCFWFYMVAKSDRFVFLDCNPETHRQTIGMQDYFRLHFDTGKREVGKAFVRGILIKPQYDVGHRLRLFLKEDIMGNNAETELESTEFVGAVEYDKGICRIELGIPWNRLGCNPKKGFTFFFDVQVWKYIEKIDQHVTLTWQDAYKPWYDITTYACVRLEGDLLL